MLLNSLSFLIFVAIVVCVSYVLPSKWRWIVLLVASYYFYSTYELTPLLLLATTTLIAYTFGRILARHPKRGLLVLSIVLELSALVALKYFNFFAESIGYLWSLSGATTETADLPRLKLLLPAGLSFFTFSCLSYLIDVYRGTVQAERHLGKLAVYIAFFPKLLAGPIEKAGVFLAQLSSPAPFDTTGFAVGLQLVVWGLFKKVVIADRLATFVDTGFTNAAFRSPVDILIAVYSYAFQIYCDFSGYSDIAIGVSLLLGIRLMENFRRPYLARSVSEFWSGRWHISLMRWFKDYVYIPMGGNRVPPWRRYFNVMVVFLLSGLWHGANWTFVAWGALNGAYQIAHGLALPLRRRFAPSVPWVRVATGALSVLVTFHLIALTWIFFRAESVSAALTILDRLWSAAPNLPALLSAYKPSSELYLAAALIAFLMVIENLEERRPVSARLAGLPSPLRWACHYAVILAVIVLGIWNTTGFVYMQF